MRYTLFFLALAVVSLGTAAMTAQDKNDKARPDLDAVLRVEISEKGAIRLRFDLPGKADQSFYSAEYRYAVLDKDGVQMGERSDWALRMRPVARHTVSLPKDERSVVEDSAFSIFRFEGKRLKSGEEYYLHAQAVHVAPAIHRVGIPARLLWAHVGRSAQHLAIHRHGDLSRVPFCQTEVHHRWLAVVAQNHVGWFDVAMHHPTFVREVQCLRNRGDQLGRLAKPRPTR
jgi:hypothetical protein